jgi:hypothetical protein
MLLSAPCFRFRVLGRSSVESPLESLPRVSGSPRDMDPTGCG